MKERKRGVRSKKQGQEYRSMEEFEKKFFPNSFKKSAAESMDSHALAASLAEESLEKIRGKLAK